MDDGGSDLQGDTSQMTGDHAGIPLATAGRIARLGLFGLYHPLILSLVLAGLTALAIFGLTKLSADDSLTELFRNGTVDFKRYEEVSRRFPSSEYDVLVVVEGKDLLARENLAKLRDLAVKLQLADGVNGLVSMLSARDKLDALGYAQPILPEILPEGQEYERMISRLKDNEIVKGKFLSEDGELALIVVGLDQEDVDAKGAAQVVGGLRATAAKALAGSKLAVKMTGAPVMQLEIRNAVERDQLVYNSLGLAFGIGIAVLFFRSVALTILASLPPILAVIWSLGILGASGVKLNMFLNVMTPLIMVLGFADSMQMVAALRDQMRQGANRTQALRFAISVVGPACVLAHGTALLSFAALMLSQSALIRTFGAAGALATVVSYTAVMLALPLLGRLFLRETTNLSAAPVDAWMDAVGKIVGGIVDHVVKRPNLYAGLGLGIFALALLGHLQLQPRYRLADQVPEREQVLDASARLDTKLTGANPVHIMVAWDKSRPLYSAETLDVIAGAHAVLEGQAGLGNVWSLESLRRWLDAKGEGGAAKLSAYARLLPQHLQRRFITKDEDAVLITGRLPDIDSSQILPVVSSIDEKLGPLRKAHPGFDISVTGLPVVAARSSADMIGQLNASLFACVAFVSALIGLAFRSWSVAILSLLPGLFPVVVSGAILYLAGGGLEFASVVALIVTFALGIDGLIHFLNRLAREERPGEAPELAIRRARVLVGPAIILTTLVLAFGLGVTVLSQLPSLRLFGIVCAMTLAASLAADLVVLPAMIMLWRRLMPLKAKG